MFCRFSFRCRHAVKPLSNKIRRRGEFSSTSFYSYMIPFLIHKNCPDILHYTNFNTTCFHFSATCFHFNATCFHFNATCFHINTICFHFKATCFHFNATCLHFNATCFHFSTTCFHFNATCFYWLFNFFSKNGKKVPWWI